jgi:glucose/arabinose dehydrogenase
MLAIRGATFLQVVRRSLLLAVIAAILAPAGASAASLVPLAPSSSWGSEPVHAASPPGDPRLFVVERGGAVRIVTDGVLRPTPFLTVPNVDTGGERGLLSIAFAPDYAASGLFYVFTVAKAPDAFGGAGGDLRVVEYRRSAADPSLADPASARLVLAQSHSAASNHNGGQLMFGPDGYLYVTMGDAAVSSNAQTLTNDLGKVLRMDPGKAPFAVPPSNPFVGTPGARPEIYAFGLRNPFRASFAPNGDLVLPDVGQGAWEEVNIGRANGTPAATTLVGANLGWPTCEGFCSTPNPSFADPFFQYAHGPSGETTGCAIIGGYVVRDPSFPGLSGRYLYGDLCRSDLRSLDLSAPGGDPRPAGLSLPSGESLLSFGEDGRGCVYVMTTATVYRVAAGPDAGAACTQTPPAGGSSTPTDTTKPSLSLSAHHRQRLRHALRLFASCGEACALSATGHLRSAAAGSSAVIGSALKPIAAQAATGQSVRLSLPLKHGPFLKAKGALRRGSKVSLRVTVSAADSSGNVSQETFRIRLSPPPRRR